MRRMLYVKVCVVKVVEGNYFVHFDCDIGLIVVGRLQS